MIHELPLAIRVFCFLCAATVLAGTVQGCSETATSPAADAPPEQGDAAGIQNRWDTIAPWSGYQRSALHRGFMPVHLDPAQFKLAWSVDLGDHQLLGHFSHAQVVADSLTAVVSVSIPPKVVAVDLATGVLKWEYVVGGLFSGMGASGLGGGRAFTNVGSQGSARLLALDLEDGSASLEAPTGNPGTPFPAPVWSPARILTGGLESDGLMALSHDGMEQWSGPLSLPAVHDGRYFAFERTRPTRLIIGRLDTGKVLVRGPAICTCEATSPRLYYVGLDHQGNVLAALAGSLYRLSGTTGEVIWERGGSRRSPVIAITEEHVYSSVDGIVEEVEIATGGQSRTWSPGLDAPFFPLTVTLLATHNVLFVATRGGVRAVDLESFETAWSSQGGGALSMSAGMLLVARDDARIVAYDLGSESDAS